MDSNTLDRRWDAEYEIPLCCNYTPAGRIPLRIQKHEIAGKLKDEMQVIEYETVPESEMILPDASEYLLWYGLSVVSYVKNSYIKVFLVLNGKPLYETMKLYRLGADKERIIQYQHALTSSEKESRLTIQFEVTPEDHMEISGRVSLLNQAS
ncbi:MAG: hypothetical protein E7256_11510 [Lachnospiraceae bacterium]|nr:hypothetical protein [Lachnospiraceae bacterium]